MDAKLSFAVLLLAFAVASSKEISYQSCASSGVGRINYVDVSPCDREPCVFRRGRTETITISFTPNEEITSAKIYAYGYKGFLRLPLSLRPGPDACQGYGLTCPLKSFTPAKLEFPVEIKKMYVPPGNYKVEVVIMNQNNRKVVCGSIELQVA